MRRALGLTLSALTVTTLALSACSSDKKTTAATTPPPSTASSTSATATASPTATPTTSASSAPSEAAQRYVSITSQASADTAAFAALDAKTPIAQTHAAAAKLVTDYPTLIKALQAGPWPTAAQGAIATLISSAAAVAPLWSQIVATPTGAGVQALITANVSKIKAQSVAASAVKVALGLPASSATSSSTSDPSATAT